MNFFITKHAEKRLKQRRISTPTPDNVKPLSKKTRKLLRGMLKIDKHRKYFTSKSLKPNFINIYICEEVNVKYKHYILITAISSPLTPHH